MFKASNSLDRLYIVNLVKPSDISPALDTCVYVTNIINQAIINSVGISNMIIFFRCMFIIGSDSLISYIIKPNTFENMLSVYIYEYRKDTVTTDTPDPSQSIPYFHVIYGKSSRTMKPNTRM